MEESRGSGALLLSWSTQLACRLGPFALWLLGCMGQASSPAPTEAKSASGLTATSEAGAGGAAAERVPDGKFMPGPPLVVAEGLFDPAQPDDLGLSRAPGTETVTIFSPTPATDQFSNGAVLVGFKGQLLAEWQSSPVDEDTPDTWVAYSRSTDGKSWTPPAVLVPRWAGGMKSNGGFWTNGEVLVAYVNVWPSDATPRGGYTEYMTSSDGATWSEARRLTMADGAPLNGIFEQDPHALPSGRVLNAAHFQPGLVVAPCYTDDTSGTSGWVRAAFTPLEFAGDTSRELEPSWFRRSDGALVMVFRDQGGSFKKLAATSFDHGHSWTTAVETNMPDSRSKQSAGNLPDGTAYVVGNPVSERKRWPLVIALSRDGQRFDKAFSLRAGGSDLPARRTAGRAKTLGYSYPKSMVYNGYLYVAYTTNKEDVEYTRIPLASLRY